MLMRGLALNLHETLKNLFTHFHGNSRSVVLHAQNRVSALDLQGAGDVPAARSKFKCIGEEVEQYAAEHFRIQFCQRGSRRVDRECDISFVSNALKQRTGKGYQFGHVDTGVTGICLARLELRYIE